MALHGLLLLLSLASFAQDDAQFAKALADGGGVILKAAAAGKRAAPPPRRIIRLRIAPECILRAVAERMGKPWPADLAAPPVRFESETPLKDFQDAVEKQWGSRPPVLSNVFAEKSYQIFLIDDAGYYERLRRTIDDSLAHEYAHVVQVKLQGAKLAEGAESLESDAVGVQTWFRETFVDSRTEPPPGCARP
jgi:hypothetical protein